MCAWQEVNLEAEGMAKPRAPFRAPQELLEELWREPEVELWQEAHPAGQFHRCTHLCKIALLR